MNDLKSRIQPIGINRIEINTLEIGKLCVEACSQEQSNSDAKN
ncbi:MAG: hypothetical protein Q8M16_00295 [Pirellulaceae bacterium]|nr:hypothetical protein [Pirellulaceae bacterium]